MKRPLIALFFLLLLVTTANIASAESLAFKKPSEYNTDSQLVSEPKTINLIKFTAPENTAKKDSVSNEVKNPFMYLKLQWDTEKSIPHIQLGRRYEERETPQMLQFFLLLQIAIP